MKKLPIISFLLLILVSCNPGSSSLPEEEEIQSETKIHWHWEDNFTSSEKAKIKKYISAVSRAAFKVLGNYPFDVHYYFKRSNSEIEPIPWAHTERGKNIQGVRFYINPDFDYEVFMADWTAPHEISHLSIPHVGRENAWFAEGYASYMQYQIMQELGICTREEVTEKYQTKIENIQGDYSDKLIFSENAKALRDQYNYKAMYWGGAMYFLHINKLLLAQEGIDLNAWMKKYQLCCRNKDKNMEMLLRSLDKDLKTPVFTNLYKECISKPFADIYKKEIKWFWYTQDSSGRPDIAFSERARKYLGVHNPDFKCYSYADFVKSCDGNENYLDDFTNPPYATIGDFNADGIEDLALYGYDKEHTIFMAVLSDSKDSSYRFTNFLVMDYNNPKESFLDDESNKGLFTYIFTEKRNGNIGGKMIQMDQIVIEYCGKASRSFYFDQKTLKSEIVSD